MVKKARRRNQELLQAIGARLRGLREERHLSQALVYIDTEIHISRVEQGRYNITMSTLSDLCDYYKITLREFFDGLDYPAGSI